MAAATPTGAAEAPPDTGLDPGTTLVLGGARSGKSAYAEALCLRSGLAPIYVATAAARDAEMAARIAAHRARRAPAWRTVEAPLALADTLRREAGRCTIVLVDCLTLWLANLIEAGSDVERETATLADLLAQLAGPVVLVSNEVGLGIVPDNPLARRFRDEAGRLNQRVAAAAPRVILLAAGLPLMLKGTPP
jgi:adenosylcobinamide kinase/adenosylcobinamide-phosphate guanylyltransferase